MAEKLNELSHRLTSNVANAYHGFHGAGEALRGTVNSTMDGLVPNHESKEGGGRARNEAVAQKGLDELHGAEEHFGYAHGGQYGAAKHDGADVDAGAGKGFTHGSGKGYSLRGGAVEGVGGEHGQQPEQQHHKPVAAGQGRFLGKGTVRNEPAGGGERLVHGEQEMGQDGSSHAGLGAAQQAWSGHQQAPPLPARHGGGEGEVRREGY